MSYIKNNLFFSFAIVLTVITIPTLIWFFEHSLNPLEWLILIVGVM